MSKRIPQEAYKLASIINKSVSKIKTMYEYHFIIVPIFLGLLNNENRINKKGSMQRYPEKEASNLAPYKKVFKDVLKGRF